MMDESQYKAWKIMNEWIILCDLFGRIWLYFCYLALWLKIIIYYI